MYNIMIHYNGVSVIEPVPQDEYTYVFLRTMFHISPEDSAVDMYPDIEDYGVIKVMRVKPDDRQSTLVESKQDVVRMLGIIQQLKDLDTVDVSQNRDMYRYVGNYVRGITTSKLTSPMYMCFAPDEHQAASTDCVALMNNVWQELLAHTNSMEYIHKDEYDREYRMFYVRTLFRIND